MMTPSIILALAWTASLWAAGKLTKNTSLAQYGFNLLVSLDQTVNTICGGDPDETISSRMGKWARNGENNRGLRKPLYIVAHFVVELFEKDHFAKSIEEDEGKNKILE